MRETREDVMERHERGSTREGVQRSGFFVEVAVAVVDISEDGK